VVRPERVRIGASYIITRRRIWSLARADEGVRFYDGADPHTGHIHVSYGTVPPEEDDELPTVDEVWNGKPQVDRQLVFDEPKTERSRMFVPLPCPVADTLKRHRAAQAAERLAVIAWAPWDEHPGPGVRHTDWDACRPRGMRYGRSRASLTGLG
jgi:hypothetical protein